jgi:hypothetical protein
MELREPRLCVAVVAVLLSSSILSAEARKPAAERMPSKANVEAATRLQVFLYRTNFSPASRWTLQRSCSKSACALSESRGEQPQAPPPHYPAIMWIALNKKGTMAPSLLIHRAASHGCIRLAN